MPISSGENVVKKNNAQNSGKYEDYGEKIAHAISLYERKKSECPNGVNLVKQVVSGKHYLLLRFADPITDKRVMKKCGEDFTEKGIISAISKAEKIAAALKTISPNEFWSWYDTNILNKSEKVKLLTYREIFADIESEYFDGNHRNVKKQQRTKVGKGSASYWKSYNRQYGDFFAKFPDWDAIPTWDEIWRVWETCKQGTKNFIMARTAMRAICKRLSNSDELLRRIGKIRTTQTEYREEQHISLEEYLSWYESAWESMLAMKHPIHKAGRAKWLWASAMNVMYGFRPSETAAILNLTKPFECDGTAVYPLTDEIHNPEGYVVIGEYTAHGTTVKTGSRPIMPVPDKELMKRLRIRDVHELTYTPEEDSTPETIAGGIAAAFRSGVIAAKCPVSQLYAFRHLYSYLCELHGVDPQVVSDSMGHTEKVHSEKYRRDQKQLGNAIKLMKASQKRPLPYDKALAKLEGLGVDINSPDVKMLLRVIYQLD